jgi:quercetin dioxygenase-like cupin family protein
MSIVSGYRLEPMVGDPDDHRPASRWAVLVDPGDAAGRVDGMAVIVETVAPGDRIPLHIHRVDEVILPRGRGRVQLGDSVQSVDDGAVVFIPAGTPHGLANDGPEALSIQAVFPTTTIWLRYLERNPAPGTDEAAIGAAVTYDVRAGTVEPDPA